MSSPKLTGESSLPWIYLVTHFSDYSAFGDPAARQGLNSNRGLSPTFK